MNKTLVGIVIVAVVIVGGYFLLRKPVQVAQTPTSSPSASPTASATTTAWKTYVNTKSGGYQIQYPSNWTTGTTLTANGSETTFGEVAFVFVIKYENIDTLHQVEACPTGDPLGSITIAGHTVPKCPYGRGDVSTGYLAQLFLGPGISNHAPIYTFICATGDATICDQMLATFKLSN